MEQPIVCATCGIIIHWQPTIVDGLSYCCPGCAQGGPCNCDYDNLPQPGQSSPMVIRTAPDPQAHDSRKPATCGENGLTDNVSHRSAVRPAASVPVCYNVPTISMPIE